MRGVGFEPTDSLRDRISYVQISAFLSPARLTRLRYPLAKEKIDDLLLGSTIYELTNISAQIPDSKACVAPSDKAIVEAYKELKLKYKVYSFLERGSDERQYNSPGIDLPISSIFRTKYGKYSEYHTSLDNFNLVTLKGITGGFKVAKTAIEILLKKIVPKNKILCEPQMGKRGLYHTLSTKKEKNITKNYMSFLQYSDGKNSLNKISKILKVNDKLAKKIYFKLKNNNLIY